MPIQMLARMEGTNSGSRRPTTSRRDHRLVPSPTSRQCPSGCRGSERRAKRLAARGGNSPDAIGPHQHEFRPARCRHPTEHEPGGETNHSEGTLTGNASLPGDQRANKEQHLIAAAHCQRGRTQPTHHARVLAINNNVLRNGGCVVHNWCAPFHLTGLSSHLNTYFGQIPKTTKWGLRIAEAPSSAVNQFLLLPPILAPPPAASSAWHSPPDPTPPSSCNTAYPSEPAHR